MSGQVQCPRPWQAAATLLCVCLSMPAPAAAADYRDLTLEQAFEQLESAGLSILYSSDLIKPWMRVQAPPKARDPQTILEEILVPYDLEVAVAPNGALMLIRRHADSRAAASHPTMLPASAATVPRAPPAEVVVSASRYKLVREPSPSLVSLSATELQSLPDIGDDPLRAISRLPGIATSALTAKGNVRGGEADETLVRFDGLRLYNPFHLKDFQSIFSTIDPRTISGINVYTGGFPVAYGDRMSGVIDIERLRPDEGLHREVALSFFNTSALASGQINEGRGDWLLSARRGNLDWIIQVANPSLGQPSYRDFHGRFAHALTDSLTAAASFLRFDDDILLRDSDREELAQAAYHDSYYWLRFDYRPSNVLAGNLLLARSRLRSERFGESDQPGVSRGSLDDRREFTIDSLQTSWSWLTGDRVLLQFGGDWRSSRGHYDYSDEVELDLLFLTPGASLDAQRSRSLTQAVEGDQLGGFLSVRVEPLERLAAEIGLRWDRETLSASPEGRFSPRASLLYRANDHARWRISWGSFSQAQSINELQASDGVRDFLPPQRANHVVGSFEYRNVRGVDVRLEAYRKAYRELRPRFENLLNTFILLPELKPDRIRIAPERATAEGIELTVGRWHEKPFGWWASYTWSSVEDEYRDVDARRSWDQTHFFTAGVSWLSERWELTVAGSYHTGWPSSNVTLLETDELPVAVVSSPGDIRLRSFMTLDARIARTFRSERSGSLSVFFEVSNLTNRANECCVEHDVEMDEEGELQLDLERVYGLPLIPSLGFIWQF